MNLGNLELMADSGEEIPAIEIKALVGLIRSQERTIQAQNKDLEHYYKSNAHLERRIVQLKRYKKDPDDSAT